MKIEQAVMSCCYVSQSEKSKDILQIVIDEVEADHEQLRLLLRYRDKLLNCTSDGFARSGYSRRGRHRNERAAGEDEFFINLPNSLYRPRQAAKFIQFIHGNPALTIVLNNNFEKLPPHPRKRQQVDGR